MGIFRCEPGELQDIRSAAEILESVLEFRGRQFLGPGAQEYSDPRTQ